MARESSQGSIVVCGLGSLGQTCLLRLLAFNVPLWGVDRLRPVWRHPELEELLEGKFMLGDMRSPATLARAEVGTARAVLLVSSESTVNFEAALQVRLLNPTAQIVVRSARPQASLGALLERRLPGIAVVDPLLLTASAVAQALGSGRRGDSFLADGHAFEVVRPDAQQLSPPDLIDSRQVRSVRLPPESHWARPPLGPTLLAPAGFRPRASGGSSRPSRRWLQDLREGTVRWTRSGVLWWRQRPPLSVLAAAVIGALLLLGVAAFSGREGWKQGLFVTLGLLKGEYVDPVNLVLHQGSISAVDGQLIAVTLLYSLFGTLLTSALVAVILDRLLQERLGLGRGVRLRRGSAQILLVQGGELATEVAAALRQERCGVVRVETELGPLRRPGGGEVVCDQLEGALQRLRSCRVQGIALLSDDLLANLQAALSLEDRWPEAQLVILAHAVEAAERLEELLGGIHVVSITDLAADALVATACGEMVEGVLRINGSNLLLVRYRIEAGDTLQGLSVSRISNGYCLTVLTLHQGSAEAPRAFPPPEVRLLEGDQMLVLADLAGLRRVELGLGVPPATRLWLQCRLPEEGHFEVRQCLARFLGLSPGSTAPWLDGQEHLLGPLDEDLAIRLRDRLVRLGIRCRIEPLSGQVSG